MKKPPLTTRSRKNKNRQRKSRDAAKRDGQNGPRASRKRSAWTYITQALQYSGFLRKSKKLLDRYRPIRHNPRGKHLIILKNAERAINPILKNKQLNNTLTRTNNPVLRHLRQ